jgi:hypothetical protein
MLALVVPAPQTFAIAPLGGHPLRYFRLSKVSRMLTPVPAAISARLVSSSVAT